MKEILTQSSPKSKGKAKKQFLRCPADQYLSSNMSSSTDDLNSDSGSKKRRKKDSPNMDITKKVKVKIKVEDDSLDDINKNNEHFTHSRSTEFDSFSSDSSIKTKNKNKKSKFETEDNDINENNLSDNVIKKHKKKKKDKHHDVDSSLLSEGTNMEKNDAGNLETMLNIKKVISIKKEMVDDFSHENGKKEDNFDSSYEFDTLSKKCKKKKRERYKEDDDEYKRTSNDIKIIIQEEKFEGNSYDDNVHTKTKKRKNHHEKYPQNDNSSDIVIKKERVDNESVGENGLEVVNQVVDARDVDHHATHESKKHKKKKSRDADINEKVNVDNFPIVKSELIINDDFQEIRAYQEENFEKKDTDIENFHSKENRNEVHSEEKKKKKNKSKRLTEEQNNTGVFSEEDTKKKGNKNNYDISFEQNLILAENVDSENNNSQEQEIIQTYSSKKKKKKRKEIKTESTYSGENQNQTGDNETYKKKKSKLKKLSTDQNDTRTSTEDDSKNLSNSSEKNLITHENSDTENGDLSDSKKKKKKKKKGYSEESNEKLAEQIYESIESTENSEVADDQRNCDYKKKKKKHKHKDRIFDEIACNTEEQSLSNEKDKKRVKKSPKIKEEPIGSETDSFEEDEDFSESERVPRMRKVRSIFDKYPKIARIMEESDDDEFYPHLQYRKMTLAEAMQLSKLKIQLLHEPPPQHEIEKIAGTRNLSKEEKEEFEKYIPMKRGRFDPTEDKRIVRNWKKFCKTHNWKRSIIYPFLHEKRKGFFFLSTIEERRKFVQFLSRRLPDRSLYSVYYRFKNLYSVHKTTRYTKEEDETILREVENLENKYKFAILSKKLNRTRCSVWRRYRLLKQKRENEVKKMKDK